MVSLVVSLGDGWPRMANCNALGDQAKDITGVLGMIGEENVDPKKHGVERE